jgi:hypothetical protein
MSHIPPSAITITDGKITIDAELLAPKLGLSAKALKIEMSKGIVYSVAEAGVDEDAGRTRLTFRYRSLVWAVVIDSDGNLTDSIAPTAKTQPMNTDLLSANDLVKSSL